MYRAEDRQHEASLIRRLHAAQVELQVLDRGQGIPLVLVHGFPLDHSMWDAQISAMSAHRRVIAPDLRGFGGSQVTPGTVTMEQMADDLAHLLDALEVDEPVVLCGLSMGGYVAFEFWRKYPARLRGLVLCDTRAAADSPEAARGRMETVEKILAEGMAPLADAMLPKLFAPGTLAQYPNAVAIQRRQILATSAEGAAAALRGMAARNDFRDRLSDIQLPALVVVGEHDAISPVEEMRAIAAAIPSAELAVIPAAGHMSPLENPEAFNTALEQFLSRVEDDA